MNKKKLILIGLILAFLLALPACSSQQQTEETQESIVEETADGLAESDDSAYSLPVGEVVTEREVSVWDGSIADGFESGYGTSEEPYVIATASQLAYLAYLVNNGLAYEGQYYWLVCDIDLNDLDWTPIGNWDHPFCGHFGGNGHIIRNFYINGDDGALDFDGGEAALGFYGVAKNSTFSDLSLNSFNIEASRSYVGGLVGYLETEAGGTSSITNCLLTQSFINALDSTHVGGLAGYIKDTTIHGCCFSADIQVDSYYGGIVGGIVGECRYGTITDCLALGECDVSWSDSRRYSNGTAMPTVGGIAGGLITSNISNCMSGVLMVTSDAEVVGGIAGCASSFYHEGYEKRTLIKDCYYSFETSNHAANLNEFSDYNRDVVINNVQAVPPEYFTDPNHFDYYYGGDVYLFDDGLLYLWLAR